MYGFEEMKQFLESSLERDLTENELLFVSWIAGYEKASFDTLMGLFRDLRSGL